MDENLLVQDEFENQNKFELGNFDIRAERKILFMNEMKWYKIQLRLNCWVQKIFQTLPPNFELFLKKKMSFIVDFLLFLFRIFFAKIFFSLRLSTRGNLIQQLTGKKVVRKEEE